MCACSLHIERELSDFNKQAECKLLLLLSRSPSLSLPLSFSGCRPVNTTLADQSIRRDTGARLIFHVSAS